MEVEEARGELSDQNSALEILPVTYFLFYTALLQKYIGHLWKLVASHNQLSSFSRNSSGLRLYSNRQITKIQAHEESIPDLGTTTAVIYIDAETPYDTSSPSIHISWRGITSHRYTSQ
jgi:hypothetical protein